MKPLPAPDHHHYDAAVGWLMLGDTTSALEELDRLSSANRHAEGVPELEWGIHAERGDWPAAAAVAARSLHHSPTREFGWVHHAYAVRRMADGGLPAAWAILRPALDQFPRSQIIAYNLACYAAQLGQLDEAWRLFEQAMAVAAKAAEVIRMALADADLKPLWPQIRALEIP